MDAPVHQVVAMEMAPGRHKGEGMLSLFLNCGCFEIRRVVFGDSVPPAIPCRMCQAVELLREERRAHLKPVP